MFPFVEVYKGNNKVEKMRTFVTTDAKQSAIKKDLTDESRWHEYGMTFWCVCLSQEAAWYLRRHRQELELLLIGSKTMGVEFTEGVS